VKTRQLDAVDRQLPRALLVAPRAPFRLLGDVIGVSDQTAAWRRPLTCGAEINCTLQARTPEQPSVLFLRGLPGSRHVTNITVRRAGRRAAGRRPRDVAHPEAPFAAATTGPTSLVVSAMFRDTGQLYACLTTRLTGIPNCDR